ncbi:hypothetical protein IIE18_12235 [Pseudomonas sp. V1]|uniref:hypothetical protein n=1 Tax=Pseudomonas arcuscaelestis TaxID=2710591 RepID=UPI00193F9C87|nr:hypothetical protein [Pseudomonas arcuscaelestis]MBM3105906.1 hypothetical protein [Pseudomonas arcuscaelestis]
MTEITDKTTEIHVGPFRYSEGAFLATLLCLCVAAIALASMFGVRPAADASLGARLLSVQMVSAYLILPLTGWAGYVFHRAGSKRLAAMLPLIGAGFLAGALSAALI